MDKEFLHKVDIDLLKKETGMTLEDIAELVGISQSRNVYKWRQDKNSGGSRPTYEAIALLLAHGGSLKAIFGEDFDTYENYRKAQGLCDAQGTYLDVKVKELLVNAFQNALEELRK